MKVSFAFKRIAIIFNVIFCFVSLVSADPQPCSPENMTNCVGTCPLCQTLQGSVCVPTPGSEICNGSCLESCASGKSFNSSCNCVCDIVTCPSGYTQDVTSSCNCECNSPKVVSNGICCPAGQVNEEGVCRVPCVAPNTNRWADGTCHACPEATPVLSNGNCCETGLIYRLSASKCTAPCNLVSFGLTRDNSSDFQYKTTAGYGVSCLDTIISSTVNSLPVTGLMGLNRSSVTSSAGNYRITGAKWADDELVRHLWVRIARDTTGSVTSYDPSSPSLGTTNYVENKKYINCTGSYADDAGGLNSAGFGEGIRSSQFPCNRGTMVFGPDCKLIKTANIAATCGPSYYGQSTISWHKSTPISLILDPKYDINTNVSIVQFALDPNLNKSYWLWKASEKSPLLVYDPLHQGKVTSATQLFGSWTFGGQKVASLLGAAMPREWANGFEALRTLDSNNDREISHDELKPLALWFDKNQDGISQPGEVQDIISFGIKSLSVVADKEDLVNKTIEATKGFIREDKGQTTSGRLVDWSSEGSEVSALLISAQLLNNTDITENARSIQTNSQHENLTTSSNDESNDKYGKNEGSPSAVFGVWRWKLKGKIDANIKGGYFTLAENGSQINGHTITELPLSVSDETSEQINHIINFAKLSGTQKANSDGSVALKFTTPIDSGIIKNEAKIASGGEKMEGTSEAEFEKAGVKKHLRYSWTAEKVK